MLWRQALSTFSVFGQPRLAVVTRDPAILVEVDPIFNRADEREGRGIRMVSAFDLETHRTAGMWRCALPSVNLVLRGRECDAGRRNRAGNRGKQGGKRVVRALHHSQDGRTVLKYGLTQDGPI